MDAANPLGVNTDLVRRLIVLVSFFGLAGPLVACTGGGQTTPRTGTTPTSPRAAASPQDYPLTVPVFTPQSPDPSKSGTRRAAVELCPLELGLNPANSGAVGVAPDPVLPSSLHPGPQERLAGTRFYRSEGSYALFPSGWHCGTLQGGTGHGIEVTPDRATYVPGPATYVSIVFTYCGAGCDGITKCQRFRWAAEQFGAFNPKYCRRTGLRPMRVPLTAIDPAGPGPYLAVIGPKPVARRARSGQRQVKFYVTALNPHTPVMSVDCVLPPHQWKLCMRNVRLFLLTSEATRAYPSARDRQILARIAHALRQRASPARR